MNVDPLMLTSDCLIFQGNAKYFTAQQILWYCVEIVCPVTVSRLEFVPVPIAEQLQPIFYKMPGVEQRVTKLDRKSTC